MRQQSVACCERWYGRLDQALSTWGRDSKANEVPPRQVKSVVGGLGAVPNCLQRPSVKELACTATHFTATKLRDTGQALGQRGHICFCVCVAAHLAHLAGAIAEERGLQFCTHSKSLAPFVARSGGSLSRCTFNAHVAKPRDGASLFVSPCHVHYKAHSALPCVESIPRRQFLCSLDGHKEAHCRATSRQQGAQHSRSNTANSCRKRLCKSRNVRWEAC